jgi:hypothetical protein
MTKDLNRQNYGQIHQKDAYEFGGPIGVTALMIWSHLNLIYFW